MKTLPIAILITIPAVAAGQGSSPYRGPIWTPIAGAFLEPFLKEAQRRRLLDRVMFGTDQMRWPEALTMAIDHVNRLDFLTLKEKEGLFYGNAAKFLGLTPEEIARHHGR